MLEIFMKMDILKIFRMQEPVSKELLSKNNELGQYKEVVHEKDVLLKNNRARIKELEEQIFDLEGKNTALENQVKLSNMDENEFQKVMRDYDRFINQIWVERQEVMDENKRLQAHIENLETCFKKLLEKYENSRSIVQGFKGNEDILKQELHEYRDIIEALSQKYYSIRDLMEQKKSDTERRKVAHVPKVTSEIGHSCTSVSSEIRVRPKLEISPSKQYMFAPLKSNIPKV